MQPHFLPFCRLPAGSARAASRTPCGRKLLPLVVVSACFGWSLSCGNDVPLCAQELKWTQQPSIPDNVGFAGPFAGRHGGALIVAGGANFADKKPWEGGIKVWYDSVFVLPDGETKWLQGQKLPQPLGYGVSLSVKEGMICLGGSDAHRHYASCFYLKWVDGQLKTINLPDLPRPSANLCGAVVHRTIYVAGGIESPTAATAMKTFWALDLDHTQRGWQELAPWPGRERMLAVAGSSDGAFYLFGGASLRVGNDGQPVRTWLRDAYVYHPKRGWKQLADLPRPAVAAPSPCPNIGDSQLLILGGDDGSQLQVSPEEHRGFPREILVYQIQTDRWTSGGSLPFSLVTTTTVNDGSDFLIPGGEVRPGVRSAEVWRGKVVSPSKDTVD